MLVLTCADRFLDDHDYMLRINIRSEVTANKFEKMTSNSRFVGYVFNILPKA